MVKCYNDDVVYKLQVYPVQGHSLEVGTAKKKLYCVRIPFNFNIIIKKIIDIQ